MKEEQILFPMIKMGNYAMASMPIRVMEMEHDEAGQDVEVIKSLLITARYQQMLVSVGKPYIAVLMNLLMI